MQCAHLGPLAGQIDCGCSNKELDVAVHSCQYPNRRVDLCVQIHGSNQVTTKQEVVLDGIGRRTALLQNCDRCPHRSDRSDRDATNKPPATGFEARRKPNQGQATPRRLADAVELDKVDVLVCLTATNPTPAWSEIRGGFVVELLKEHGITAAFVQVSDKSVRGLRELLSETKPKVVINRAFAILPEQVASVAAEFPHTQFVAVNHSSHSWTAMVARWVEAQSAFLRLARERRNCWFATVEEHDYVRELNGAERAVWLPNVVRQPKTVSQLVGCDLPSDRPIRVSLSCRFDALKAIGSQIIGAAIANAMLVRSRGTPIVISAGIAKPGADLVKYAEDIGVKLQIEPWSDWKTYTKRIANNCQIGLQATYSDSFNYVALEHMLCGLPTICGPAIVYRDRDLHADPEQPTEIADKLIRCVDDYVSLSKNAITLSGKVAQHLNASFVQRIAAWLE